VTTTQPVVLIAEELAPSVLEVLGSEVEIRHVDGADRAALIPALAEAAAVMIRSATQIDAEALAAAPNLKVVARAGIGLDNVDVPAATERGVMVVNAPTSNIVSAAEHAVALLLAAARQIPAADASLREGAWKRSKFMGVELTDKTVGVVGLGRIGGSGSSWRSASRPSASP
jgi:D-3-phosphoglycerate dehydrogenase / 2-oxoglutarate reductase